MSGISWREPDYIYEYDPKLVLTKEEFIGTLTPEIQADLRRQRDAKPPMKVRQLGADGVVLRHKRSDDVR